MKVVLDTNVLLAALATHGLCEAVFLACLEGHEIVLSEPILVELARNLASKFKVPAAQVRQTISFLRQISELVRPAKVPKQACRDPDDLMVLGTALAAKADCLVSGDEDLLVLGDYQGIPILSPREFYSRVH